MRVIAKPALRNFWENHPDARLPLQSFYKAARQANWSNIQQVRETFPTADAVTLKCGLQVTVFNIGGNKYRLVVGIVYAIRRVYIKAIMTHAEYDKGKWKVTLCERR